MHCHIYRSSKRPGTYVYLTQRDDFTRLPPALTRGLGPLEFSMEIELRAETRLASQDVALVLRHLAELGYHVQFPPSLVLPGED